MKLAFDSDNVVRLEALADDDGNWVNDAEVTWVLQRTLGDADTNLGDGTMDYVEDSNGEYKGTIPYTAVASRGDKPWLVVTAVSPTKGRLKLVERAVVDYAPLF